MVGPRRVFKRDRAAQVAIADAVIALIVLTIASAVIYSAVSGAVSSRSDARQRADLKTVALESSSLPLEAAYPVATFTEVPLGTQHKLINLTGEALFLTIFELECRSNTTGEHFNLSGLLGTIKELYEGALEGRSYAVHAYMTSPSGPTELLFSSEVKDGQDTTHDLADIPNPRIVTQKVLTGLTGDVLVDLYLWR
jgi:hypothetical protein